jgi:cyclic pyranopterin phosphate synthase
MPLDAAFMDESNYLTSDEYFEIVEELCSYGLEELRLTGGEPLMRRSFSEITAKLATLPLKKIGLTTNGIFLDRFLADLKRDRVHHLNISLDSLDAGTFQKITHGNHLPRILKNIESAQKMGFHIKINMVAMKGVNDHELFDFVGYSEKTGIPVRFLELMRIGQACGRQEDQFISAQEMITRLKTRFELQSRPVDLDSTSFNFLTNTGAEVGFIASESQAFCSQCSRWRLSADGIIRACLLKNEGLSIKKTTADERQVLYRQLLGMKPFMRPVEVNHLMHSIGG